MFGNKSESWLIVGLGNPGKEYEKTRHNCGFRAIDVLADKLGCKVDKGKFQGLYGQTVNGGKKLYLLKPQTFMNLSGQAVTEAISFHKVPAERVIVIMDDISLEPGKMRIRRKGSDGGQKGMRDIIELLGNNEIMRIKIGVGKKPHPQYDLADWVLSKFKADEKENLDSALKKSNLALKEIFARGIDSAMNKYNGMTFDE